MSSLPKPILLSSCLLASLLASGCNWTAFEPYVDTAPIRVHGRPSNFPQSGYGAQLASLQVKLGNQQVSSIFASAGGATPVAISRAWTGSAVSESGAQL